MSISLVKGQKIDLRKNDGSVLRNICVGVNWGAIEKKGFFGTKKVAVDLDASCAVFDNNNNLIDLIYFGQLNSKDGSIQHSGDDLTGDIDGDDGLDNEIILVNLDKLSKDAKNVVFILNSFKGQDFASIPFASIRIYEGSPQRVNEVFATFNIASDPKFSSYVSMVMAKIYKKNNEWKFSTIGEPTKDRKLQDTVKKVSLDFL